MVSFGVEVQQLLDVLVLLFAAVYPLILAIRISNRTVRTASLILFFVLTTHALFHVMLAPESEVGILRSPFLAFSIVQPISVILLVVLGILLHKSGLWMGMFNPVFFGELLTVGGLIVAFILFGFLAIRSWNINGMKFRSFKFGLSIAVMLWIIPEIFLIELQGPSKQQFITEGPLYPYLHTASMILLASVVLLRSRQVMRIMRRRPRR